MMQRRIETTVSVETVVVVVGVDSEVGEGI
jgi:hypothetical protein